MKKGKKPERKELLDTEKKKNKSHCSENINQRWFYIFQRANSPPPPPPGPGDIQTVMGQPRWGPTHLLAVSESDGANLHMINCGRSEGRTEKGKGEEGGWRKLDYEVEEK